jgi:hypothetical protein
MVAVDEDKKVVGTMATISYQKKFSWIGMVLVDPKARRQGIGTKLLEKAIDILSSEKTIKLDATPAGREVYRRLNFIDEYPLSRMLIDLVRGTHQSDETIAMHADDLENIISFDEKIFGANRLTLLRDLYTRAPYLAFLKKRDGDITGFCLGRTGYNFTQIGPVISDCVEDAMSLVRTALQAIKGPVIIDIPHHSKEWVLWLTSIGFIEQRPFVRMYRGSNSTPGRMKNHFAILGPEFG